MRLQNRLHEAEDMFLRAKSLSPKDSTVYQHYGEWSFQHFWRGQWAEYGLA